MDACPVGFVAAPSWQRPNMVPLRGIIIWAGAANNLPPGYQLCDGSNDTPNLLDKFVMCAGPGTEVDETGGAELHEHTSGASVQVDVGAGPHVWTDQASALASSNPEFYALAYIQRMS